MSLAARARMTYAEYLSLEEASGEKHEFAGGEMFAMSGGTPTHARLQVRVASAVDTALRGRPCATFGPDLRLYISALDESAYADTVVVCGPVITDADPHAATNPTVVCEVLSPSTEAYDRGRKFEKYRLLPSLQEYVLVSQDRPMIEVFRREGDTWVLRAHGPGTTVALASVGVTFTVDAVYQGVLPEPETPAPESAE